MQRFFTLFFLYKWLEITWKTLLARNIRKTFLSLLFTGGWYWWLKWSRQPFLACLHLCMVIRMFQRHLQGRHFRLSYCLCPVLPDCKQGFREVVSPRAAGDEFWYTEVTPSPWSWLWEQSEKGCDEGCPGRSPLMGNHTESSPQGY